MRPNRSWQVASGSTCMWFLIHCEKPLSRFLLMAPCHGLAVICWVWTALKHLRVYLLRRHKFHTPLKTVHTTLLNLHKSCKKQCRKTSDTFSPTFNILANSSSYTFCVCVYPFTLPCLFSKHQAWGHSLMKPQYTYQFRQFNQSLAI